MANELDKKIQNILWVSDTLFQKCRVTGSTGNISFRDNQNLYVSASGSCFGRLKKEDFSVLGLDGHYISGPAPSKEWPLHVSLYSKPGIECVIHTHSFYATLWSCISHDNADDVVPQYTPYLKMKLGAIKLIPYAEPGSKDLFDLFERGLCASNGYLLKNHGLLVGGKSIMDAFYCLEELEESIKTAWYLEQSGLGADKIDNRLGSVE